MGISQLMVVRALPDAGRNGVSGMAGKGQGDDAAGSFQALLEGQVASRQPDKPGASRLADSREAEREPASREGQDAATVGTRPNEPVKEGDPAQAAASDTGEEEAAVGDDAAVLAEIMAALAGAQMAPVESMPVDDAAELADGGLKLAMAADRDAGVRRKMPGAAGAEADAGNEAVLGKRQADVKQDMRAPAEKLAVEPAVIKEAAAETTPSRPSLGMAAMKEAAAEAASPGPSVEQLASQAQPQPQPQPVSAVQVQQVQQAFIDAQADPAADRIMQRLGTPEWNQAVGQRVLWMVGQEQQSASLTLNPPELGPVRVVVNVSSNQASAHFFSAQPDVRQALEGSLPRLREMLEGAGIQLGEAQVGAENSDGRQPGKASGTFKGIAGLAGGAGDAGAGAAATDALAGTQIVGRGLVDTFA